MASVKKPGFRKGRSSVRSRVEADAAGVKKERTLRSKGVSALTKVRDASKKHYYLPLPDTKLANKLNKPRTLSPNYFKEAWAELKNVTWPKRKETWRLTFAVFAFAVIFGLAVAAADYGFDQLFRKVLFK